MTDSFPYSLREISSLPEAERNAIYSTLIAPWVYEQFGIDPATGEANGHRVIQFRAIAGSRAVEIIVRRDIHDRDPVLYLHMTDTFNNQILVLLVVVNDPDAPRFNTDFDQHGNRTVFGTASRNIPAEIRAMEAGLAPGQVRRGLRVFSQMVPIFEQFIQRMGHDIFLIEPLAYHNAIVFERYGFSYVRGLQEMKRIHEGFQPGNDLHHRLASENPFRQPDAWRSVRKRSWAIHDGILGYPFTGFQMYKRIGRHAGVQSFPAYDW
ncbi:MAG: hypothetical protein AAFV33_09720 [Chloroflexota bacterium]